MLCASVFSSVNEDNSDYLLHQSAGELNVLTRGTIAEQRLAHVQNFFKVVLYEMYVPSTLHLFVMHFV